jgi:hypothetical protein
MSFRRLHARLPSTRGYTNATLAQHQLRFHKHGHDDSAKCDAYFTGQRQDRVYGIIFDIAATEKVILDQIEGVGQGYDIKEVILQTEQHGEQLAFTYYATHISPQLHPFHWYKQHVLIGAEEAGLPQEYIKHIKQTPSMPDQNLERVAQEEALYSIKTK